MQQVAQKTLLRVQMQGTRPLCPYLIHEGMRHTRGQTTGLALDRPGPTVAGQRRTLTGFLFYADEAPSTRIRLFTASHSLGVGKCNRAPALLSIATEIWGALGFCYEATAPMESGNVSGASLAQQSGAPDRLSTSWSGRYIGLQYRPHPFLSFLVFHLVPLCTFPCMSGDGCVTENEKGQARGSVPWC